MLNNGGQATNQNPEEQKNTGGTGTNVGQGGMAYTPISSNLNKTIVTDLTSKKETWESMQLPKNMIEGI